MKLLSITGWEDVSYKQYEKIVAAVLAGQLATTDAVHTVEHDAQQPYAYGEKQIDVHVTSDAPDTDDDERITLVECKNHKQEDRTANIEQDVVASLAFYLDHSDADAAVVVAREGFQTGAKNIARGRDDIRLFRIGELTAEEQAELPDPIEFDLTLTFSDYRHVVRVTRDDESDWQRLRDIAAKVSNTEIELLTATGDPIGETIHDRLEEKARAGDGKIRTEFDGERVEVDDEEYEVLEAMSQENPGPVSTTEMIDFADKFDITMADPIALEDAPDDLDQSEKAKIFKSFKEVRHDLLRVESG